MSIIKTLVITYAKNGSSIMRNQNRSQNWRHGPFFIAWPPFYSQFYETILSFFVTRPESKPEAKTTKGCGSIAKIANPDKKNYTDDSDYEHNKDACHHICKKRVTHYAEPKSVPKLTPWAFFHGMTPLLFPILWNHSIIFCDKAGK